VSDAPDIGGALSRQLGPLPVGGWLLAAAGGIAAALFIRSRRAATAAADETAAATVPDGTVYTTPNGVGQSGAGGGGALVDAQPTIATNADWQNVVIRKLIARGYDPSTVDSAVRSYLAGDHLSVMQRAIIAEALVLVGPPPLSPPPEAPAPPVDTVVTPPPVVVVDPPLPPPPPAPVVVAPPPPPVWTPPPPAPAPAQPRYPELRTWHTNVSGDNYSSIAAMYGTGLSGTELYNYQFSSEAGRPASTQATLRSRGTTIYAGGSTAIPYPR
jgi:hypothetical protein